MEGKKICYFHKFNFCKKGEDCKYFHPSEVCDGKCDIKVCLKRHPQTSLCMFHTMFEAWGNQKSCKFRHVTPQPVDEDQKEQIQILQRKIQKLEEDNKKITDSLNGRISLLETEVKDLSKTVRDLTNNEMIRLQEEEMMEDHDENDESNLTNDSSAIRPK